MNIDYILSRNLRAAKTNRTQKSKEQAHFANIHIIYPKRIQKSLSVSSGNLILRLQSAEIDISYFSCCNVKLKLKANNDEKGFRIQFHC